MKLLEYIQLLEKMATEHGNLEVTTVEMGPQGRGKPMTAKAPMVAYVIQKSHPKFPKGYHRVALDLGRPIKPYDYLYKIVWIPSHRQTDSARGYVE